jgi:integrase
LYRFAAESGLRRNELRTLTVGAFDFAEHTVTVKAEHTKNHKDAVLPLKASTAAELKQFFAGKLPNANAFGGTCLILTRNTSAMIQEDLKAAGIAYKDEAGRFADFHSLRHSTGTLLAAAGVHPKTAQTIMRHSDIRLTMGIYTHTLTGQESQAVESLPDLSQPSRQAQQAKATGTDDAVLPSCLPIAIGKHRTTSDSTGQANRNGDIGNALSTVSDGVQSANQQSCYPAR